MSIGVRNKVKKSKHQRNVTTPSPGLQIHVAELVLNNVIVKIISLENVPKIPITNIHIYIYKIMKKIF